MYQGFFYPPAKQDCYQYIDKLVFNVILIAFLRGKIKPPAQQCYLFNIKKPLLLRGCRIGFNHEGGIIYRDLVASLLLRLANHLAS